MKCETFKCKDKSAFILTYRGKQHYVCSNCWIDLQGLRADFNHSKKKRMSPPN